MAKITVVGDAAVVTSSITLANLKKIEKYRPKALTLFGGEDGKEPVFKIGTGSKGSINEYGATFSGETHDDKKLATITIPLTGVTGDVKEYVAESTGTAIININKIERSLGAALEEIDAEKAEVLNNITVA